MNSAILYTKRPSNEATTLDLLNAGGYVLKQGAGLYVLLPLGTMLLRNIESIIHQEAKAAGFCELCAPSLQDSKLWESSGRLERFSDCMFFTKGNNTVNYILGASAEEVYTKLADTKMPGESLAIYSLGERFRNEYRPTSGLVRSNAFRLADFYYIGSDANDVKNEGVPKLAALLESTFAKLGFAAKPALRVFNNGLDEASQGALYSYWTESESKQCQVYSCSQCGQYYRTKLDCCPTCQSSITQIDATELGDVNYLNNSISRRMLNAGLIRNESYMAIAGIGVTRCMQLLAEKNRYKDGFVWPRDIAPFEIQIIPNKARLREANNLVDRMQTFCHRVLLDDRDCGLGRKFIDADLIGAPIRITLGNNTPVGVFEILRDGRIGEEISLSALQQRMEGIIDGKA